MKARDIPNIICVIRILLVLPVVIMLLRESFASALVLFTLAGASDGLDGFLARRFNWRSRLGAILDPLADKLLMVSTYATLGWMALLPWWLVLMVLLRDVVIIGGAVAYHRFYGEIEVKPTRISKANTVFQILLVLLVMLAPVVSVLPVWIVDSMIMVVAWTTLLSGMNYVWVWSHRARSHRPGRG